MTGAIPHSPILAFIVWTGKTIIILETAHQTTVSKPTQYLRGYCFIYLCLRQKKGKYEP